MDIHNPKDKSANEKEETETEKFIDLTPTFSLSSSPITDNLHEHQVSINDDPSNKEMLNAKEDLFYRLQRFLSKNPLFGYLMPVTIVFCILFLIYAFKDYAKLLLFWIENQDSWVIFIIIMFLFTLVSFPITVGYLVLIITSGYLFGFVKGLLAVMFCANLGVFIAHNTIKKLQNKLPIHK